MGNKLKIGIVGCGAIGCELAIFLDKKFSHKAVLVAVCDIKKDMADNLCFQLRRKPQVLSIDRLISVSDLIIEAASLAAAKSIVKKAVKADKDILILSVGAFVEDEKLLPMVAASKSKLYVPSGAIAGIDGVSSLRKGQIKKLIITTSKPPRSLGGIPFLKKKGINLFKLIRERVVFDGNIRDAIKYFPQNINVAATLFLASAFNNIRVIIKADPNIARNVHRINVVAAEANINIEVENFPSPNNPKTSYSTVLSVKTLLEKITSNIKIGS
ncbi:MAG: aspartate dehydrogenase domain-containing protein [Candidatus Omnitrophota bacterium]